ncbi:DNA-binding GntR family transcriptional regulator [Paraburkholderia sp. BL18I3N2]|uniref:GntR family transcriptional regulator n=1 Tax=Paraburkholderia sp. BL18I3N2 TaxID=1938799 RepID=UPI000D05AE9C|nr:GntR family transcriptional regulator [Paraburkholderia sp. BL18I3N2]PRX27310.1 DNA-binding GntR family transcriptional regulator [Paraburkholderia sp. BL18I3N2]
MSTTRRVVQSDRLRDQIYQLLREDLHGGAIPAGARLVELDLAERYGVSRTPVREALFQLAREGLVVRTDRGYSLMKDTPKDFLQRMEVRLLLDPALAEHAAKYGSDEQIDTLSQVYEKMKKAAETSKFTAFVAAAHQFRTTLLEMSHNTALTRVCAVLEDQFLLVRNEHYKEEDNRAISVHRDGLLLDAIRARDVKGAGKAAKEYVEMLIETHTEGPARPARKKGSSPTAPTRF